VLSAEAGERALRRRLCLLGEGALLEAGERALLDAGEGAAGKHSQKRMLPRCALYSITITIPLSIPRPTRLRVGPPPLPPPLHGFYGLQSIPIHSLSG